MHPVHARQVFLRDPDRGHAADDIVAETFLLAFRQRGSYDQTRADARPWLYGIATNLIGRHRRAEIRLYRALARTGGRPGHGSSGRHQWQDTREHRSGRCRASQLAGCAWPGAGAGDHVHASRHMAAARTYRSRPRSDEPGPRLTAAMKYLPLLASNQQRPQFVSST